MELILTPLVGGALSLGEIRGGCVPGWGQSLGSLFPDGQGCDPTWIVFALGLLNLIRMGMARFSQNGHLQRMAWLLNIPESFAFNVLPSQQATFTHFPRRSSKNCSQV